MKWIANNRSGIIYTVLFVLGLMTVVYCLLSIGRTSLSTAESNLLAVTLMLASLFLSWVMTTLYHNIGTSRTMRDKDVQRANMIQSIKQQLSMLRDWNGRQALERVNEGSELRFHCDHVKEVLAGLDCQFDAMIKEIGGNIGDADRQAHELLTSVKVIGTQLQNLESERQRIEARSVEASSSEQYDRLQSRILEITKQQETLTNSIAGMIADDRASPASKEAKPTPVGLDCPYCGIRNRVEMVGFPGETRASRCRDCQSLFNAHCTSPGHFIARQNYTYFTGHDSPRYAGFSTLGEIKDSISPPGFDFSPAEFKAISTAIVEIYEPKAFTIKSLNEAIVHRLSEQGYTKSRIGKFIQMLFWTRLFDLAKSAEEESLSGVPIGNEAITLEDIGRCFFCSIGYRMANLRRVEPDEAKRDIEGFLEAAASALDAGQMTSEYVAGKTAANEAARSGPGEEL